MIEFKEWYSENNIKNLSVIVDGHDAGYIDICGNLVIEEGAILDISDLRQIADKLEELNNEK